jgi:hypothetical protein
MNKETKFKVGDKAHKPKGYKFPCTIVGVFETIAGEVRVIGEMDEYGLLHIFNENQLEHYNEEQPDLLNEVYENYWRKVSVNNEEDCLVKQEEGSLLKEVRVLYQQEFINKIKTDPEFSEKWGLKIEERELSLEERWKFYYKKELDINRKHPEWDSFEDNAMKNLNSLSVPTKLITIKYNDTTIQSYV